jgi:DNA-binding transcriptional regulator/RsmH inhibitor MraZ
VVGVEASGRVRLPSVARRALGATPGGMTARAMPRGGILVVRSDDAAGAALHIDGRGRLSLPAWWRRVCAGGACAVATRTTGPLVVLAPTGVLDGLADVLVGERL